jgi:FKBP-type peptidyl-prolyl cis-trans isomerase FklB
MKKHLLAILGLGLLVGAAQAQDKQADDKKAFKTDKEKISYAIGMSTGGGWKRMDIDVDLDAVGKGIKDSLSGGPTLLTEQESREVLNNFGKEIQAKRMEKQKVLGEKNKAAGEAFLAENKKKDGVITLPSGLQYKVIKEGAGENPKADDTVSVNYRGTLIDGTEFDSSEKRGQAASFRVGGVIKGWTEALQLMKPGAKWQLFIPSDLAYGPRGTPGGPIGPNETLIFEVELIKVK